MQEQGREITDTKRLKGNKGSRWGVERGREGRTK